MRLAPPFQLWMTPSRFLLMMASSEVSTIEASRRIASSARPFEAKTELPGNGDPCIDLAGRKNVRRIVVRHEFSGDLPICKNWNECKRRNPLGTNDCF